MVLGLVLATVLTADLQSAPTARQWIEATIAIPTKRYVWGWFDANGKPHYRAEEQPSRELLVMVNPDGSKSLVMGWNQDGEVKYWPSEQPAVLKDYRVSEVTTNYGVDVGRMKDGPLIRASDSQTLAQVLADHPKHEGPCPGPKCPVPMPDPIGRVERDMGSLAAWGVFAILAALILALVVKKLK